MLIAILAVALLITFFSKWYADRAASAATLTRLHRTGALCANANYPLTSNVLTQIEALSGIPVAIVRRWRAVQGELETLHVEQTSSGFPADFSSTQLSSVCEESSRGEFDRVKVLVSEKQQWNSYAQRLSSDSGDLDRFIVMLERIDMSNREKYQAFWLPIITGLCSLAAIFIVATILASRIGARIESLKGHVARIAQGEFKPIQIAGPADDLHSLSMSINSMSEQLRESTQQMAASERTRLINLIASGIAHELRNHLTGARLAIQTCEYDSESHEALSVALKQLRLAEESVQRLLSMRKDASDGAPQSMSVNQVIESALELTLPIAKHHRSLLQLVNAARHPIRIEELELGGDFQLEHGNEVVGALINLILNGIQAAGVSGRIEIAARPFFKTEANERTPYLELLVRDNGPGPAKQVVDAMFEPFTTTKPEGVGLGLTNCRRVAQMHDGLIVWQRTDDWTEFVMTLKLIHCKRERT